MTQNIVADSYSPLRIHFFLRAPLVLTYGFKNQGPLIKKNLFFIKGNNLRKKFKPPGSREGGGVPGPSTIKKQLIFVCFFPNNTQILCDASYNNIMLFALAYIHN